MSLTGEKTNKNLTAEGTLLEKHARHFEVYCVSGEGSMERDILLLSLHN